jgi:hypothetical protein
MQVVVAVESTHQAEALTVPAQAASVVVVTDKLVQAQVQAAQELQTPEVAAEVAADKAQVQGQSVHIKVVMVGQVLL